MSAAIYARFSTENQRDASIEDQYRVCERAALAAGLTVTTRFEDRGISGGTAERPGYQGLLAAARAGSVQVIVAEDISRLWRNRAEYGARSAELEDLGVHLVTCVGDDTRREGWGLVLGIKQAVAEHARREISHRTKRGMEGKALAKESTGGKCYGYGKSMSVIEPLEASRIRDIFVLALSLTPARIAAQLNQRGWQPPRGRSWGGTSVALILRNRRYLGAVIYGQTEGRPSAVDSRRKRRTVRQMALVAREELALQIVSPELFKQVQIVLDSRTKRPHDGSIVK